MKLGRVTAGAVAALATVALLSGCAQNTASASASESASGAATAAAGGLGVTAYVAQMRAADFVVPDKPADSASEMRKASETLKFDRRLVLAGNEVCQVVAEKAVSYGDIVQKIVDRSDRVNGTGPFVSQERDSDGKVVSLSYDDERVPVVSTMDYRMAEAVVRTAVQNLCPTFNAILPGFTPAV